VIRLTPAEEFPAPRFCGLRPPARSLVNHR
jgi:hypothetical protein